MTPHNNNGNEYLLVEVDIGAKDFKVYYKPKILTSYLDWEANENYCDAIPLPPYEWQILFLASEATEEQAGEVVIKIDGDEEYKDCYPSYIELGKYFSTALASLQTLLTSYGLSSNCIVLKKIK